MADINKAMNDMDDLIKQFQEGMSGSTSESVPFIFKQDLLDKIESSISTVTDCRVISLDIVCADGSQECSIEDIPVFPSKLILLCEGNVMDKVKSYLNSLRYCADICVHFLDIHFLNEDGISKLRLNYPIRPYLTDDYLKTVKYSYHVSNDLIINWIVNNLSDIDPTTQFKTRVEGYFATDDRKKVLSFLPKTSVINLCDFGEISKKLVEENFRSEVLSYLTDISGYIDDFEMVLVLDNSTIIARENLLYALARDDDIDRLIAKSPTWFCGGGK